MAATPRKPMQFNVGELPRSGAGEVTAGPPERLTKGKTDLKENIDRQQVGARVSRATYRQLKAKAALSGQTVQTLVEQAIADFLAK